MCSYEPPEKLLRGLDLFLLAFPLQLAAILLGYSYFAITLNALLLRVVWWYFVVMTFTLRKEQIPSRRSLQIFFATITMVFTPFWFLNFWTKAASIATSCAAVVTFCCLYITTAICG